MKNDKQSPRERDAESGDEGFLGRWSRRKQAAREGGAADAASRAEPVSSAPPPQASLPAEHEAGVSKTDEPKTDAPKTDEDMPPIESLDEHSDYSQFLSSGVSEKLRRVALRKLFHLPRYNIRDGMDDYDLDYTKFTPLGNIITSDMRLQLERMAEKFGEKLEDLIEEVKTTGEMPDFSSESRRVAARESPAPQTASEAAANDHDPKTPT